MLSGWKVTAATVGILLQTRGVIETFRRHIAIARSQFNQLALRLDEQRAILRTARTVRHREKVL